MGRYKTHIAGKWKFWDLKIGDKIVSKTGRILTGKGKGVVLDGQYARFTDAGNAIIESKSWTTGKENKITLSKQEIKAILKNFKDSR